jgi:ribosomal protein L40E
VIKCIWLFILGVILALVGLYTLLTRPDMGTNPFIIMLMGLFFTAAGSIYGKRKMAGQAAVADYVVDPAQMLQVRPADAIPQPQPKEQQPQYQPFNPALYQQRPHEPAAPAVEAKPTAPVEAKPAEIRKIFVCPDCGAENEMEDKFCFKCGNKFVKPKKKVAKAKKPAKKVTSTAKVTAKVVKAKRQAVPVPKKKAAKEV